MSFTGGGVGRRGNCTRKVAHSTRASAERALERAVARGVYRDSLKIVRCWYGKRDHFHLAHAISKGRKGRRAG